MYFDIAALIFIVVFSWLIMKKGGVQTVLSLISMVLSVVIAICIYPYFSKALYNTPLDEKIFEATEKILTEKGAEDVVDVMSAMPEFFTDSLKLTISGTPKEVIGVMAQSITETIINIITFVLVFIAAIIILKIISWALNLITKIPGIKQLNSLFGLVCGVLMSFLIVSLAVYILSIFAVGNPYLMAFIKGSRVVAIISGISPF